jgi:type IV secretory pathway VirB2 component (pilin)
MLGTVLSAIATTVEFLVLRREARHAAGLADITDFTFNISKVRIVRYSSRPVTHFVRQMVQGLTGSYVSKLIIVVIEIGLSIAFGITMYRGSNLAAGTSLLAYTYLAA